MYFVGANEGFPGPAKRFLFRAWIWGGQSR